MFYKAIQLIQLKQMGIYGGLDGEYWRNHRGQHFLSI